MNVRLRNVLSSSIARRRFGEILTRAGSGNERFVIRHRDEPIAVILGVSEYVESGAASQESLRRVMRRSKRIIRSRQAR